METTKKLSVWNDIYPFCQFENDIAGRNAYILEQDGRIIGSFVLDNNDDPDYCNIKWTSLNKNFLYLSRLAILPTERGKDYVRTAVNFACGFAHDNGYDVIRLTVHTANKYAIWLYEGLGFEKVMEGFWQFDDKIFIGYEKYIN